MPYLPLAEAEKSLSLSSVPEVRKALETVYHLDEELSKTATKAMFIDGYREALRDFVQAYCKCLTPPE